MREFLIALVLLVPGMSSALTGRTTTYSENQIRNTMQCPPRACALDDLATTYSRSCDAMRAFRFGAVVFDILVFEVQNSKGKICYCHCGPDSQAQARNAAIQGGRNGFNEN